MTSKLQVTLPKSLADELGIKPGDEIEWQAAGETIRIIPVKRKPKLDVQRRLELFDEATRRQKLRRRRRKKGGVGERGWTREELYRRGGADRH